MPTAVPCSRADRLCGAEALVGVGRRHPDVDDRDIRLVLAGRAQEASASPAWATTSKPASASRRATPSRSRTESSARTTPQGHGRSTNARIAAPEIRSLGMNPRTWLFADAGRRLAASRLDVSTTSGGGPSTARALATSKPSMSGRPMSSSTKSGCSARAASRPERRRRPRRSRRSRRPPGGRGPGPEIAGRHRRSGSCSCLHRVTATMRQTHTGLARGRCVGWIGRDPRRDRASRRRLGLTTSIVPSSAARAIGKTAQAAAGTRIGATDAVVG